MSNNSNIRKYIEIKKNILEEETENMCKKYIEKNNILNNEKETIELYRKEIIKNVNNSNFNSENKKEFLKSLKEFNVFLNIDNKNLITDDYLENSFNQELKEDIEFLNKKELEIIKLSREIGKLKEIIDINIRMLTSYKSDLEWFESDF